MSLLFAERRNATLPSPSDALSRYRRPHFGVQRSHFDSMPRMWAVLIRSVKGLIWLTAAAIAPLYLTNDTSRNAVIGKGNWLINFMMSELQHLGEAGCLNTRLWLWFWTSVQFSGEKNKKLTHKCRCTSNTCACAGLLTVIPLTNQPPADELL